MHACVYLPLSVYIYMCVPVCAYVCQIDKEDKEYFEVKDCVYHYYGNI